MKLIQLNIWQGRLAAQACKFLAREQPDFVCLQEVYSAPSRPELFDVLRHFGTLEALKAALPEHKCYFSPTYDMRMFNESIYYGNAIFSRFPLSKTETFFINGERKTVDKFQLNNTRNLQRVRVQVDEDQAFTLVNHHALWTGKNQLGNEQTVQNMQRVAEIIRGAERPLILAGDLNISPVSPALRELTGLDLRNLTVENGVTNTLSSAHRGDDKVACDYIFSSPEIGVKNFRVNEELVSDHKALVLEFEVAKVATPSKQVRELELLSS